MCWTDYVVYLIWWQISISRWICRWYNEVVNGIGLWLWCWVWVRGLHQIAAQAGSNWCGNSGCLYWTIVMCWIDWQRFFGATAMNTVQERHIHFGKGHYLIWSAARFARIDTLEHIFAVAACASQCTAIINITWIALSTAAHSCIWIMAVQRLLAFTATQWIDS